MMNPSYGREYLAMMRMQNETAGERFRLIEILRHNAGLRGAATEQDGQDTSDLGHDYFDDLAVRAGLVLPPDEP